MATFFIQRKSLFGRMLGISSSGGLVMSVKTTAVNLAASSDINLAAQMWGPGMFTQATAAGALIANHGFTQVTTASTAGSTWFVAAPTRGVEKRIFFVTTSSGTLTTTSTLISFLLNGLAGSTVVNVNSTLGNITSLALVGLSTTQWLVAGRSGSTSIST